MKEGRAGNSSMTFGSEKPGQGLPSAYEMVQAEHFSRMRERYFQIFSEEDLERHLHALAGLSPEHPVELLLDPKEGRALNMTVLAFDYPGEFSVITGVLAGAGFNILSGDVFTYEGVPHTRRARRPTPKKAAEQEEVHRRRKIIDHFSGVIESPLPLEAWAGELREMLLSVIRLLEQGEDASLVEAKRRVQEGVTRRLALFHGDETPVPYPVDVEIDNDIPSYTRLKVVAQDTPAFLYTLSNALSIHDVSIEHVRIRTERGRVEDMFDLVDLQGRKIEDPELLNRVRLSALLTKQFTHFLDAAPDPFAAFTRFEHLLAEMTKKGSSMPWQEWLQNPKLLQDLARVLGASDFFWEDFVRLHYETLLVMLRGSGQQRPFAGSPETLQQRLEEALLKSPRSLEEQAKQLNEFKDREIFLLDLDHILNPGADFRTFSLGLTALAEAVVKKAAALVHDDLVRRFGRPRTVAGLEVRYAILGLGKLGGAALGYASDLELMFLYSDNGHTDGENTIENSEFFARLVRGVAKVVHAKREGIFHLDFRLRPYGNAGPLACSLESFCRYYEAKGPAHAYERLALVRLRAVGGDAALGKQVERLRDEMVYFSGNIQIRDLRDLREKQFVEKTKGGRLNAKFSPGGLVDLEYSVQMLQASLGKNSPRLRTPLIHEALGALSEAGALSQEEAERLVAAYAFLRRLINSMRMLRGSAQDLFFPVPGSHEYAHLARRMGYLTGGALDPSEHLHMNFEIFTAVVRVFVERHFGSESLPGRGTVTVADLVLSDSMPPELRTPILEKAGFKNPERAYGNLRSLAGEGARREIFSKLALLAVEILSRKPDPDMALNNWERFIHSLVSPEFHFNLLLSQPMRIEMILGIFSGSQFLSDTLVRNPGFLDWLVIPEILHRIREKEDLGEELRRAAEGCMNHGEWLNKLRRIRRREMLRIGARDICLGVPVREVFTELSILAEALVQVAVEEAMARLRVPDDAGGRFCILALGKLGGMELNYSSDIDLLGVWDDRGLAGEEWNKRVFTRLMEEVRSDLSQHTEEGYVYRVDLRLRPFGREGELVPSLSTLVEYYRRTASLWEIQAALKARSVAGNLQVGRAFLETMRPIWLKQRDEKTTALAVDGIRSQALNKPSCATLDVKNGLGGLRDVEFLVQGLQLIHAWKKPDILKGNTLLGLEALGDAGIVPVPVVEELKQDYHFLRRVEHYLQIMEDRQIHAVPSEKAELRSLAKRVLGVESDEDKFITELRSRLCRVRNHYGRFLMGEVRRDTSRPESSVDSF